MTDFPCPTCGGKTVANGGLRRICTECGKQSSKYQIPRQESQKSEVLQKLLMDALQRRVIPVHHYYGDTVRFGVVSDTHIGSLYEHNDVLCLAYKVFKEEGIKNVYHAGDLCEGENMFKGQEYEIYAHGADAQVRSATGRYPREDGITTHFISGSHDLSFYKRAGNDIGRTMEEKRPDMKYVGREEADILIKTKHGEVILRLVHPGKGTAYALSYHPQKYLESLSGGQKPGILVMGHYHKAEYIPCYRNVFTLQAGCIQQQTPFMKRQNLAAHVGFWTVEFRVAKDGSIMRLKTEFFAHYEDRLIKNEVKG